MMNEFKTIFQGALGALTFGIYHQYVTQSTINTNNNEMRIEMDKHIEIIKQSHNLQMNKLNDAVKQLQQYGAIEEIKTKNK